MTAVRQLAYACASMTAIAVCPIPVASAASLPAVAVTAPQAAEVSTRAQRAAARRAARDARKAGRRRQRAIRQAVARGETQATYTGADGTDIVVVGLRKSVEDSIDKKRRSREIVDSVTAEDAGKLPDNNVVEAMARITGVDITRGGGRGNGFTIRGLDGVQTTINGNAVEAAGGRSIDLSSIAPDLVKAIDVYKTRGANQPEGGIAGSVNVELRRPLDLKKGWTVAGSFNETFNTQGNTRSPNGSLLIGKRFDTALGEMGVLLTGAYLGTNYVEPYGGTESPYQVGYADANYVSPIRQSLPANVRNNLLAPYRGYYGVTRGATKSPTLYGSYQWKLSDHLNFVFEGTWIHNETRSYNSNISANTRDDYYTVQNPVVTAGNLLTRYDLVNILPSDGSGTVRYGRVGAYVGSSGDQNSNNNYNANFEIHWSGDGFRLDSSAQYNKSNYQDINRGYDGIFPNALKLGVDFESPLFPAGGPVFNFYGVDITRASQQDVNSFHDNYSFGHSRNWAAQQDLSLDIRQFPIVRNIQLGWRYSDTKQSYNTSYRYAGFFDPARPVPIVTVPGVGTVTVTPPIQGGARQSFTVIDPVALFNNWSTINQFVIAQDPSFRDGIGRDGAVASQYSTLNPSGEDVVYAGGTTERTFATYANVNYGFKAVFPIDGTLGVRYVNTALNVSGRNLVSGQILTDPVTKKPILDADGNSQYLPFSVNTVNTKSNFRDILPNLFGNVHFTDKLNLRLSWTHNVQRPSPYDLRDYRNIDYSNTNADVYAGNPDLKPVKTDDYNAALEWYFARGGIVSLTFFNKDQTGFIYYTRQREAVPELGGAVRYVGKPRNAGPGKTQGLEAQATGFFNFLPGLMHNFGATVNGTWIPTARLNLPVESADQPGQYSLVEERAPFTSTFTYNIIGYYESKQVSVRLTYNKRSRYKTGADAVVPFWIQDSFPTSRFDAAVNYTPVRFLTLVLEGQNLTRNIERFYYDYYPDLRAGSNQMGRTIKAGARFRF